MTAHPPLSVGGIRLTVDDGILTIHVHRGDAFTPVARTGLAGGVRLRTDTDVDLEVRDTRVQTDSVSIVMTGDGIAGSLTATPRTLEPVVDVVLTVTLREDRAVESLWSDWHFIPNGIELGRAPAHAWVPNLRPEPNDIIGDHTFRSPAVTVEDGGLGVALLPDLRALQQLYPLRAAFDYRADTLTPRLSFGLTPYEPRDHCYYSHVEGTNQRLPVGTLRLAYGVQLQGIGNLQPPAIVSVAEAVWDERPDKREDRVAPQTVPFGVYALRGYREALREAFVVTADAGPGTGGVTHWLFPEYVSFHSRFNNLRSAYGLRTWGLLLQQSEWGTIAEAMRRLWLTAPSADGFTPTFYKHTTNEWLGVNDLSAFGPALLDATGDRGLLGWWSMADNCWTHIAHLRWLQELDLVSDIPDDTAELADRLTAAQADDGSVPSFFACADSTPNDVLAKSAETALAVWLWNECNRRKPVASRLQAAHKGATYLRDAVVQEMRYADSELYHSCSRKPLDFFDPFTHIPAQSTLAMQWTAEALLGLWRQTKQNSWLDVAVEALSCLAMYQQVWDAPFLSYDTYGGFGTMNTDAAWSDARQGQFARTFLRFAEHMGHREYAERGVAALRSSFTLMTAQENRHVSPRTYTGECPNWPAEHRLRLADSAGSGQLERMPDGYMLENYGHLGTDALGIRSGFDWGEGSALTAAAEVLQNYAHLWVHASAGWAIGIDGWIVEAERHADGSLLVYATDGLNMPRDLTICLIGNATRLLFSDDRMPRVDDRFGRTYATVQEVDGSIEFTVR